MPRSPLLDQVRRQMRLRHYSLRTERTYLAWIKRYVRFHNLRHPADFGKGGGVVGVLGALQCGCGMFYFKNRC